MTITGLEARAARQLLGWTQDELAVEARLSPSTIGHFESGRRQPSPPTWRGAKITSRLERRAILMTAGASRQSPGVERLLAEIVYYFMKSARVKSSPLA